MLADGGRGVAGAYGRRDSRLVDRRDAGEQRPRARRHRVESPCIGCLPTAVTEQRDLFDAIRHMNWKAPPQQAKHLQCPGRFVRKRPLQHQHRAVISEAPDVPGQRRHGRCVHVERMVRGIAGDDGAIDASCNGGIHGKGEAPIDFDQVLPAIVKV